MSEINGSFVEPVLDELQLCEEFLSLEDQAASYDEQYLFDSYVDADNHTGSAIESHVWWETLFQNRHFPLTGCEYEFVQDAIVANSLIDQKTLDQIKIPSATEVNPTPAHVEVSNALSIIGAKQMTEDNFTQGLFWTSFAAEINPESADVYTNKAYAHSKTGDLKAALKEARLALQIDPQEETYQDNYIGLLKALRDQHVRIANQHGRSKKDPNVRLANFKAEIQQAKKYSRMIIEFHSSFLEDSSPAFVDQLMAQQLVANSKARVFYAAGQRLNDELDEYRQHKMISGHKSNRFKNDAHEEALIQKSRAQYDEADKLRESYWTDVMTNDQRWHLVALINERGTRASLGNDINTTAVHRRNAMVLSGSPVSCEYLQDQNPGFKIPEDEDFCFESENFVVVDNAGVMQHFDRDHAKHNYRIDPNNPQTQAKYAHTRLYDARKATGEGKTSLAYRIYQQILDTDYIYDETKTEALEGQLGLFKRFGYLPETSQSNFPALYRLFGSE